MCTVTVTPLGQPALSALTAAVAAAQQDDAADPFARVVVIAAHHDVASSVRHLLGTHNILNVTAQTGERLAAELARPILRPPADDDATPPRQALSRLHESRAVRRVTDRWLKAADHNFSPGGRRRLYAALTNAFRQWEQRAACDDSDAPSAVTVAGLDLPALYDEFRALVDQNRYYTRYELPLRAAQALPAHWPDGAEPAVIYYLPRHPTVGELELMQALLARGKCRVLIGLTGDADADGPARDLYRRLTNEDVPPVEPTPLQRAAADAALTVTVAPDPVEEARTVARRIAAIAIADAVPFYRIAIIHRQESPYASLLRQELDFAGIPSSGIPRRALADTGAGRFLLGALALVTAMDSDANAAPTIDRERFIDLIMSCPLQFPPSPGDDHRRRGRRREIPSTRWANLSRAARANGTAAEWQTRLTAYVRQQDRRRQERDGDGATDTLPDGATGGTGCRNVDLLIAFIDQLALRLGPLRHPGPAQRTWQSASKQLKELLDDYHGPAAGDDADYRRITEILDDLPALADWEVAYDADDLRETIGDELQHLVSARGRPVGDGVYVGPPAGIMGARYDVIFAVGLAEGQFPPPSRRTIVDEWRHGGAVAHTRRALERYEFLGALAAADRAALSYPVAGASRRMFYPSPWLLEAANLLHEAAGATGRLNTENLTADTGSKPWLTVIASRETGLRRLAATETDATFPIAPADRDDYNLVHLLTDAGVSLASHPAWATDDRAQKALKARTARQGQTLTEWDGRVGSDHSRVSDLGAANYPVSPSALETWASCPYRYMLSRVLGIATPAVADAEDTISALDRGSLVHRILEKFVKQQMRTEEDLLALADAEFADAERMGITGYPLLWALEKEGIRAGLQSFFEKDTNWLGGPPLESKAEVKFKDISLQVSELGAVHFRGSIDRLDVLDGGEVRVRDFKTGDPRRYLLGPKGGQPDYTVANGRALQLPVYVAAARKMYPDADIQASYCFPLSDDSTFGARPYTDADAMDEFYTTLRNIIGTARAGIFPATPEGGERGNCHYCDFNRLCPVRRRRQFWERKGRKDPDVQPFNALGGPAAIEDASASA